LALLIGPVFVLANGGILYIPSWSPNARSAVKSSSFTGRLGDVGIFRKGRGESGGSFSTRGNFWLDCFADIA